MPRLSRLLLASVGFVCVMACARSSNAVAQQTAFPDETTSRQWRDYEKFARSLQGTCNLVETNTVEGGNEKTKQHHFATKQNSRGCLIRVDADGRKYDRLYISNRKYTAELRLYDKTSSKWTLSEYRLGSDGRIADTPETEPLEDSIFATQSPHMVFQRPLAQLFTDPKLVVVRVTPGTPVPPASQSVVVEFRYKESLYHGVQDIAYEGSLTFANNGIWHLSSVEQLITDKRAGKLYMTDKRKTDYTVKIVSAGFPVITNSVTTYSRHTATGAKREHGRMISNFSLNVDSGIADREFDLAHYGLPEPIELATRGWSIPSYFWYFAIGFILILGGLARRRIASRTTQVKGS